MISSLLIIRCSLFRSPPCCGVIACRHVTSVAAASGEREREMAKGAAQPSVGRRGGKAPSDNTRALPIGEISDALGGWRKIGSHAVREQAFKPMRSSSRPVPCRAAGSGPGSLAARTSLMTRPVSSTTQSAVSSSDTSNPAKYRFRSP